MASQERWGVAVSDLHTGGITSLRPPVVRLGSDSDELRLGPITKQVWAAWTKLLKTYGSPDFLLVGGDCVNGNARKDEGRRCWTTDIQKQADVAAELINMWNAPVVFGVEGTKYHVENINGDEMTMRQVRNAADYKGRYAPPDWNLSIAGAVGHISHKIGGTRVFQYRGTPLSRELTMSRVMSHETEVFKANFILRGHVHNYYAVRAGANSQCCTIPCWQTRTDYEALNNPFVWMPHIGALIIEIKNGICRIEPVLAEIVQRADLCDIEEKKREVKARNTAKDRDRL